MKTINVFENETEAKDYAFFHLGKHETEVAMIGNKYVLLAGTPMVEDFIVEKFAKAFEETYKALVDDNINGDEIYDDGDLCNSFIDAFTEGLKNSYGLEIIYGTTEY